MIPLYNTNTCIYNREPYIYRTMIYNIICETLVISSEHTCELFPEPKWEIQALKKRLSQKEGDFWGAIFDAIRTQQHFLSRYKLNNR